VSVFIFHVCLLEQKRLRIGAYGYNPADIVVMLDGGKVENPDLAPTHANIVSINSQIS